MGGGRGLEQQQVGPTGLGQGAQGHAPDASLDPFAWDGQNLLGNAAMAQAFGVNAAPADAGGGGAGASYEPTDEDIAWIAALGDAHVREQIDGAFSEDAVRKQVSSKTPRKRDQTKEQRTEAIEAEVQRRMGQGAKAKPPKGEAESLTGDEVFQGLDRKAGTVAARKDFVALGVSMLGSVGAVEDWFSAVSKADAPGGVWLHESARRRYEAARRKFQADHPGWDFEPSYVGFQTRHRQHARNSTGMLCHLLGLAVDVAAIDNPHLSDANERVLIETVGGQDRGAAGFEAGHSRLKFAKPDGNGVYSDYVTTRKHIEAAGKATERGEKLPAEAARLVGPALDQAYAGFRGTEARMQGALDRDGDGHGDEVAELRAVAQRYWAARKDILAARQAIAAAERELKTSAPGKARAAVIADAKQAFERGKADKVAQIQGDEQREAERRGEPAPKPKPVRLSNRDVAEDETLSGLKAKYDHLRKQGGKIEASVYEQHPVYQQYVAKVSAARTRLDAVQGPIVADKDRLLAPWFQRFDQRLAGYDAEIAGGDPAALKGLDRALGSLAAAKSAAAQKKALEKIHADPALSSLVAGRDGLEDVKGALKAARDKAAASKDATANREVVQKSRGKLDDLDWVFGASDALTVSNPTGLQLAEHGLLWQGESTPGHTRGVPSGKDDARETWMREFTRVMMEHGFAPGGEWKTADTMHFELVEGMNRIGRGTFGPKGRQ